MASRRRMVTHRAGFALVQLYQIPRSSGAFGEGVNAVYVGNGLVGLLILIILILLIVYIARRI